MGNCLQSFNQVVMASPYQYQCNCDWNSCYIIQLLGAAVVDVINCGVFINVSGSKYVGSNNGRLGRPDDAVNIGNASCCY